MRILITGGTGFVGSHLIKVLETENEIVVLTHEKIFLKNSKPRLRYVLQDLTKPLKLNKIGKIDCLIHLAQGNKRSEQDYETEFMVNVLSTFNLLDFARQSKIKQFVYASSAGIYGFGSKKFNENDIPKPDNLYAGTKMAAENLIWQYRDFFQCKILRLSFPYGPGTPPRQLFGRLISNISESKPVLIKNDSMPRINPVYIQDLVNGLAKALKVNQSFVLNLGGQKSYSIKEISIEIGKILKKQPKFNFKEEEICNQNLLTDISLAKQMIDFDPKTSLKEGLLELIKSRKDF